MPKFLDNIEFYTEGYSQESLVINKETKDVVLNEEWNNETISLEIPSETITYPAEGPTKKKITDISRDIKEEKDEAIYKIGALSEAGLIATNDLVQRGLNALNSETQDGLDQIQDKVDDGLAQLTELNISNGPGPGSIELKDFSYVYPSNGKTYNSTSEASGIGAIALGEDCISSGENSFSAGVSCVANNKRSVSMQNGNHSPGHTAFTIGQVNKNWANGSFVFGNSNIAGAEIYEEDGVTPKAGSDPNSQYSIIGGQSNKVRGQNMAVFGQNNIVNVSTDPNESVSIGFRSIVSGYGNNVRNTYDSIVSGTNNKVGMLVDFTDAEKTNKIKQQNGLFVIGSGNIVDSGLTAVFGQNNTVKHTSGEGWSFVSGSGNYTGASSVCMIGQGLRSDNGGQTIVGKYNKYAYNNSLFVVGNGTGTASAKRSNAFEVYGVGGFASHGDSYVNGKLSVDGNISTTKDIVASGDVYAIFPEDHKYANSLFNVSLIGVFDQLDEYIENTDQRISTEEITRGEQINLLYGEIGSINTAINNSNAATLSHINNKENPHEVTKSQVGLGLVLNYGQTNAYKDKQNSTLYFNAGGAYNLYMELKKYIDDQIASAITTALNTPV